MTGKKLQVEISNFLSKAGFNWVDRAGFSGWSLRLEWPTRDRRQAIYSISYDDKKEILKIGHFVESWERDYKGFCSSMTEFKKIIKRLDLEILIISPKKSIELYKNRTRKVHNKAVCFSIGFKACAIFSEDIGEKELAKFTKSFEETNKTFWDYNLSNIGDYEPQHEKQLSSGIFVSESLAWYTASKNTIKPDKLNK